LVARIPHGADWYLGLLLLMRNHQVHLIHYISQLVERFSGAQAVGELRVGFLKILDDLSDPLTS